MKYRSVMDKNGVIVKGIYKTPNGSLVVDNKEDYDKYIKQKQYIEYQDRSLSELKQQVQDLKEIVLQLMESNKHGN